MSRRSSVTSPDINVQSLFETIQENDAELKSTQAFSLPVSKYKAPENAPERLKEVLLPGLSPMSQETVQKRMSDPAARLEPNFNGLKQWYDDQIGQDTLYSNSDWKEARKFVKQRVMQRRDQSVNIRESSTELRTTGAQKLSKKSIDVKTNFISRIEEIGDKEIKLKVMKKQTDTEIMLMDEAIKRLTEFNQTRFGWPSKTNEQCLKHRMKRVGIDLVADDVDFQLKRERNMLTNVSDDLERINEDATQHLSILLACSKAIGEDIARKNKASKTEAKAEKMTLEDDKLKLHVSTLQAPPSKTTMYSDWLAQTPKLAEAQKKLISVSKDMRKSMAKMQEETEIKVKSHDTDCGAALRKRVTEYQEALDENRVLLASVKHEITTVLDELRDCCEMVEAQEQPIKRTTTRLKKREIGRSDEERTMDAVHEILIQEAADLTKTVQTLQEEISTHNANLEDLRNMEVMLEEDLAIKINSHKIDNKCIYMRSYFAKQKAEKNGTI